MKKMIKNTIKKLLFNFGFEFRRVQYHYSHKRPIAQQKRKKIRIGSFDLIANQAHQIENHLKQYSEYSRNLPRIATIVNEKWTNYNIIDVGANIGDTVALLRSESIDNKIYCIEPVKDYFDLLKHNTQQFLNIKLFNYWLSEFNDHKLIGSELNESTKTALNVEIKSGTARQKTSGEATKFNVITLSQLVSNESITNVKLLKIDTDGYDFKIIRGGLDFIKSQKPILFFEYDAFYLTESNDDGWLTLALLRDTANYEQALYYDNFGRFLCSFSLKNERQAKQLLRYIKNYSGAFPYFDVCLFHEDDADLAEKTIEMEEKRA